MKIDGSSFVQMHTPTQSNHTKAPQQNLATLAANALAEARSEALAETQESLSLALANGKKKIDLNKNSNNSIVDNMSQLLEKMDKMSKEAINKAAQQLSQFKDSASILNALDKSGMTKGDIALVLTSLLGYKGLDSSIKKALKKRLEELILEGDIELEILAATSGANLDKDSLRALGGLYQHAKAGEEGLAHWFDLLSKHKDRKKYIKILIKAMSEPLDDGQKKDDMTMVAATIIDLRRLLIFMTFEDHCRSLAKSSSLDEDKVKSVTLEVLDYSWIYVDALALMIQKFDLVDNQKFTFIKRWRELFFIMSDQCYKNPEQKIRIDETLLELSEKWIQEEEEND